MTTGEDLRDLGQDLVMRADEMEANAGAHIRGVLDEYIESGMEFSADDIREAFAENPGVRRAMELRPNLLPAVMGGASRTGRIVPVGICKPMRSSRHANRNLVWRAAS